MAKRFIDTGFFKSPFVRGLKGSLKSLYCYIICDCDGAGIWSFDLQIAGMYTGFNYTQDEFNTFVKCGKAIDLKNGRYFFPDFIEHQYPKGLSEHNPAHKNFINELRKYSLIDGDLKPLQRPFEGSKVMVMVKDKVEVKEMVKVKQDEKKLIFPHGKDFMRVWEVLITQPKWKSKNETALQASLNKLSKVTEEDAIEMMTNTISGNWQGIFELQKPKNYGKQRDTNNNETNITTLRSKSRELLREVGNGFNQTSDTGT